MCKFRKLCSFDFHHLKRCRMYCLPIKIGKIQTLTTPAAGKGVEQQELTAGAKAR